MLVVCTLTRVLQRGSYRKKKNLNPYPAVQNSGSHTLIDAFLCKEPGVGAVATLGGLLDKLKEIRGLHKGM